MRNRMKFGMFVLGLLGIAGGLAACSHPTMEQRADWITGHLSSKLDLSAEQKAKLDTVKVAFLEIHKAHKADRAKQLEDAKQMILADHLDAKRVRAKMAERQKIVDENFDGVFAKIADFHGSLSTDQKKKAVELIDKFASHWTD